MIRSSDETAGGLPAGFVAARVPQFVRRAWLLWDDHGPLEELLSARGITAFRAAQPPDEPVDAIIVARPALEGGCLAELSRHLDPQGYLFYYPATGDVERQAKQTGLAPYLTWEATSAAQSGDAQTTLSLALFVHVTYDPMAHARELLAAGNAARAYEVLSMIPERLRADPRAAGLIRADMQYCLLDMDAHGPPGEFLRRFFLAQRMFYDAVSHVPDLPQAYHCHAAFWLRAGDSDMAARLLRSLEHLRPVPETRELLAQCPPAPEPSPEPAPPNWTGEWPRRLLFILPPEPHYGLDVLYDGLCRVLDAESVVDFPFKPTLHGGEGESQRNYPCFFRHGGTPRALDRVCDELRAGEYDCILYGDLRKRIPSAALRALFDAATGLPLCIVDQEDDPADSRRQTDPALAHTNLIGYAKREMLTCWSYAGDMFPLPFAYPDSMFPEESPPAPRRGLFWAGHRFFGLRRPYLERLEQKLGRRLDFQAGQEEYRVELRRSSVALSLFGFGFDTVRYWEAPANGCLLLAERPPIRIPLNFEDNIEAVFFDDLPGLERVVDTLLADPARIDAIAAAGYRHFREHHRGTVRARHLLGWLERLRIADCGMGDSIRRMG